ncbi:isoprenylcysteine carboxylmethyltransferase family protein [Cellulophaga sp. F20128]|uniref:methyltransferase family protein n=1 Tax=Cellulophaga sp. F20128 TaxID=2926413 RepID=UPI001FF24AD7|nr:isoprenylcysteine carboxylmethyltransferase family protein [Cellulophaga sp. F20128]MCK0158488.1 isoprenylcysteine carboxylmethyltransferase family protein [Cellulophaga sp. F20128]
MKLKIPPIVVMFIFGLGMYLLAKFSPIGYFDFYGRLPLAKTLVGIMVFVLLVSTFQFLKARTSIDPIKPDKVTSLVTSGIYKYSRNPMYLAMLLVLLAWGLYLGNAFNVLLAAGFVSFINTTQIKLEEGVLGKKFGKDYTLYRKKARRWF